MKYCSRPFEHLYCMPNGDVSLCGWMNATIGNILEKDIEEIWNGKPAERARESIKDGSFRFCRKVSCPYCERGEFKEIDENELVDKEAERHPISMVIANDIICNHNCPSCRDHVFSVSDEYNERLKKQLDVLLPTVNKLDNLSLNGAGELFASPVMMDFLQRVQPEKTDFALSIQTNGVLFNEKNWNKISHLSKYFINVTVTPNSFDRQTYEYLSGFHNDYEKILENLNFMAELRSKEIINNLQISIVVQDRNFGELPEFVRRCLYEFAADKVVIKPLYKWFWMNEELYWFKDILNPCHPYHKEYLKILEDPILDNPKVYLWGARNVHEAKRHPAYKYKDMLEMVYRIMNKEGFSESIKQYIASHNIRRFILYGDNELSKILNNILRCEGVEIYCILARDICDSEDSCQEINKVRLSEYVPDEKDLIFITNWFDRTYVERDLSFMEYSGKVTDVKSWIESM